MPRLVYLVTHPVTARLVLRGQLARMREWGYDVALVTSPGPDLDVVREREGVEIVAVPMRRDPSPVRDAFALAAVTAALRRLEPDLVNASTPKAGLLGMLAAATLRVRARVYLLRGLRLETERGATRAVLGAAERSAAGLAHSVVCVSESLRRLYVRSGYAPEEKTRVLGAGSSNGVDAVRFAPTDTRRAEARELRVRLGIAPDAPVVGFVGRFVRDKGTRELLDAFDLLRESHPGARLLMIGAGLGGDALGAELASRLGGRDDVILASQVPDTAPYYGVMDVLAFPSYREGFPNVPLEAAAAEVPAVGFRATGVVDAIVDGETGTIVEQGDAQAFSSAIARYLGDAELRRRHGVAARRRAKQDFDRERVWAAWHAEYQRLLAV